MSGGLLPSAALAAVVLVLATTDAGRTASRWRVRARIDGRAVPRGEASTGSPIVVVDAAGDDRRPPAAVRRALDAAGIERPALVWRTWLRVVGGLLVASVVLPVARVLFLVALLAPPGYVLAQRGRAGRRRAAQLPAALDAVASGLRAGHSLSSAIEGAASVGEPLGPELAGVARDAGAGRSLVDVLRGWADRAPDDETTLTAAALRVAAQVGGPGARAIDAAAASLRDRQAARAEADALATQGRVSALVLTVAPVAFTAVLAVLDSATADFLLGSPIGLACLVVGGVLDGAGAVWMARLVRRNR